MKTLLIILLACLPLCPGCAYSSSVRTNQSQSNLATFLFGGATPQRPAQKVPLALPARVGVAFVPGDPASSNIPETIKKEVVDAVKSQLSKHSRYVAGAQSIPTMYLSPKGGVSNLEQVAEQFDVDVIVLLGANQFQKHERNPLAAFLDLTVIGSFVIPGNTVDTSTVLEAAVYHVPSRALIFRTDGSDEKASRSTAFGSTRAAHNDAVSSIEDASGKLVVSISNALVGFEKFDVSKATEISPISDAADISGAGRDNYWGRVGEYRSSGGGSFDLIWIMISGAAILCTAKIGKHC
ncbi:MAG: rhombotarget lipoprotein [Pseudomonadota bacterium]